MIDQKKIPEQNIRSKEQPQLSVAILAGGEGRRLGGCEKAFLIFRNQTFLKNILNELSDFDDVMISVRDANLYESLPHRIIVDETPRIGPIGAIFTCLKHSVHEYVFVCAVDMPYFKKELMMFVAEFINLDYDAFIIRSQNKTQTLCGIYRKTALPALAQMIDEASYCLLDLYPLIKTKYLPFDCNRFDEQILLNINTKADLSALKKPAVFCVSGVKNSGKTTLIAKLIQAFKKEGYRVGVIKHDGHDFEIDQVGSDTYQYQQAGSDATLIYSKCRFTFMKRESVEIEQLLNYFDDVDLVVIEGLKDSIFPKIEVILEESVCQSEYLLAVVTDGTFVHSLVPTFRRSDIDELVMLIKRNLQPKIKDQAILT